jgi:hypothetical protein
MALEGHKNISQQAQLDWMDGTKELLKKALARK